MIDRRRESYRKRVVVVEYHWPGMFPSVHDESGFQVI